MIKNNFRILKKQYAYLQTILKAPVKFEKDWPKTVGGVAGRGMVGALMDGWSDGQTDRQTDRPTDRHLKFQRVLHNTPPLFWWRGIKTFWRPEAVNKQ